MFWDLCTKDRRYFLHAPFSGSVLAHDNRRLIAGVCVDISVLGLSFMTPTEFHPVGSEIFVHIKPGSGLSAFNATCEIVSLTEVVESRELKYGLRFVKVAPLILEEIHTFTQKNVHPVAA